MSYRVEVDGESTTVELVERAGRLLVRRDGVELPVELCRVRGSAYSLLLGTESIPVVAIGKSDDMTLTLGSQTWHCAVQDEREALAAAALGAGSRSRGGGVVRAVMPGIVREVLVREGDVVTRGAPLVILEAMKMQNEVRAETDGRVTEVHVKSGTAVAKGDALITAR